MTLTEQWKKGDLKEGFYYVTDGAEVTIDYYLCDYWERHFDSDVQEVLAPVMSYEEWQELINKKYWCNARAKNLLEKNQKLKELLKDCRQSFMGVIAQIDEYEYLMATKTSQIAIDEIDNAIEKK